jgi:hypothetical protein
MVNAYYLVSNKSNVLTSGAFKPTVYTFVTSGSFPEALAPNPSPPAAPYVNALSLFNGKIQMVVRNYMSWMMELMVELEILQVVGL